MAGARTSILVVDDHKGMRSTLERVLRVEARRRAIDVCVQLAGAFAEARECIDRDRFDAFVIDVRLGGGDDRSGLDLLAAVRRRDRSVSIFVLTGLFDYDVASRVTTLGAEYVPKEGLHTASLAGRLFDAVGAEINPGAASGTRIAVASNQLAASLLLEDRRGLSAAMTDAREDAVRQMVAKHEGNVSAAARELGMSRQRVQAIVRATKAKQTG